MIACSLDAIYWSCSLSISSRCLAFSILILLGIPDTKSSWSIHTLVVQIPLVIIACFFLDFAMLPTIDLYHIFFQNHKIPNPITSDVKLNNTLAFIICCLACHSVSPVCCVPLDWLVNPVSYCPIKSILSINGIALADIGVSVTGAIALLIGQPFNVLPGIKLGQFNGFNVNRFRFWITLRSTI